jgi:hypothetical protein
MSSLTARDVEHARAGRKSEHIDQTRRLTPIALEREQRLVLEQILIVEVRLPPFGALLGQAQKKTGSRYAPNTSSIAARISYSVQ